MSGALEGRLARLPPRPRLEVCGRVVEVTALVVRAALERARQGELVELRAPGLPPLDAEVVALRGDEAVLLPLGSTRGLIAGAQAVRTGRTLCVGAGEELRGRVLDGLGRPVDGRPPPRGLQRWPVERPAPAALDRPPVAAPLQLGVRALDGLLTAGEGQRIGLFAGAGVGKSTLLAQIVAGTAADVVVAGLVGERGREVGEFVERALGAARERAVVVAATSDAPALVRVRAAQVATAVAEWFAEERGQRVLLVLDSLTRFARALREVGLAAGEPPARQGYPPSVFAELPRLVERAGTRRRGCITAIYTVLVAGGDLDEPIADEVRGLLDGHVVLDRAAAERGQLPPVDVLRSVSRAMPAVVAARHRALAARARALLGAWAQHRDLVALGAYAAGSDPLVDEAIARMPRLEAFLRQPPFEASTLAGAVAALDEVLA